MLSETLAGAGHTLLGDTAPDGRAYWSARFWDRDAAERHPVLAEDFLRQKETLAHYLETYAADARTSLEIACGTGEFTLLTAQRTGVTRMTATDISAQALEIAGSRVDHPGLVLQQRDFWAFDDPEPADLVVCVDAIHHLGNISDVVARLRGLVAPGGILVGNLFTADNFHEFERRRYGALEHLWRTTMFLGTALAIRLSGGRLRTGAHRTQLLPTRRSEEILAEHFTLLEVSRDPYFTAFVARA